MIKLNPTRRSSVPFYKDDILDRRSELEGNVSIFQNFRTLEQINDFLVAGAFNQEFLANYHIQQPIKFPRSFAEQEDKPYHIPFIEMSADLQEMINYESKLIAIPNSFIG